MNDLTKGRDLFLGLLIYAKVSKIAKGIKMTRLNDVCGTWGRFWLPVLFLFLLIFSKNSKAEVFNDCFGNPVDVDFSTVPAGQAVQISTYSDTSPYLYCIATSPTDVRFVSCSNYGQNSCVFSDTGTILKPNLIGSVNESNPLYAYPGMSLLNRAKIRHVIKENLPLDTEEKQTHAQRAVWCFSGQSAGACFDAGLNTSQAYSDADTLIQGVNFTLTRTTAASLNAGEPHIFQLDTESGILDLEISDAGSAPFLCDASGNPTTDANVSITSTRFRDGNFSGSETYYLCLTRSSAQTVNMSAVLSTWADLRTSNSSWFDTTADSECQGFTEIPGEYADIRQTANAVWTGTATCSITINSATPTSCDAADNQYDLSVNVTYKNAPKAPGGTYRWTTDNGESIDMPVTTSALTNVDILLSDLTADGSQDIDLSVEFLEDTACTTTLADAYNAPAACTPTKGVIEVTKVVTGAPAGFVSPQFNIQLVCTDHSLDQNFYLKDGETKVINDVPAGTQCTVSEISQPPPPAGYTYSTEIISPSGETMIPGNVITSFSVVNPLTPNCKINQPTVTTRCDDNGTGDNSNDDQFSFTLNTTGEGVGTLYDVSGDATTTGLSYNSTSASIGDFMITNGNLDITLTDRNDASCSLDVSITAPSSCSTPTPKGSVEVTKTVTGAPAGFISPTYNLELDCTGTTFDQTFSLNAGDKQIFNNIPEGTTCTVNEPSQPSPPSGYRYETEIVSPASVTIVKDTTVSIEVTNPLMENCAINSPTINTSCDDNGTNDNTADDIFSFTLNTTGTATGSLYDVTGDATVAGLSYNNTSSAIGSFVIANGSLDITLTDGDNASCSRDVTVNPPATCSTPTPKGTLEITKTVTGAPGGFTSPTYNIQLACSNAAFDQSFTLNAGDTKIIANIPEGTTCSVTEPTQPAPPSGYRYETEVITPSSVTIVKDSTASINVTNPLTQNCAINVSAINTSCDDNGTDNDMDDDRFSFTINASGVAAGASYSITGDASAVNLNYGNVSASIGDFTINSGDLNITLVDDEDNSCTRNVVVNAPASCSTTTPAIDLNLVKTASKTTVLAGEKIVYTLSLTNNGPDTATAVEVNDSLPISVNFIQATASRGTYDNSTGIWNVGNVAKGETVTLDIEVSIQ
jgi:uncharacterized repeat protein (TIGR01451 family)